MRKKPLQYIFLLTFLLLSSSLLAINRYDHATDTMTYRLYEQQEWGLLYKTVKKAHYNEVEFYYLELRGAFAAFYTQRYYQAVQWFNSAEEYKKGSDIVQELHYLAALYAGLSLETKRSYALLSDDAKTRYAPPTDHSLLYCSVLSGYNKNSDFKDLEKESLDEGYGVYGERTLLKDLSFNDFALGHQVNPRLILNHTFELLNLNKIQDVYYNNFTTNELDHKHDNFNTKQWLYNVQAQININDIFHISPAFTCLNYETFFTKVSYDVNTTEFSFEEMPISELQYIYALQAILKSQYLVYKVSGYITNTPSNHYYQTNLKATYQPFLNKKYYISTSWTSIYDDKMSANMKHSVFSFMMEIQMKNMWLKMNHSTGDHQHYVNNNGAVVYNNLENIHTISGVSLAFPLFKNHLWANINYRYINYESKRFYTLVNSSSSSLESLSFSHFNHSISGGLSWYF